MFKIFLPILIGIYSSIALSAPQAITCTHPRVCHLIEEVLEASNALDKFRPELAVSYSGDPHMYDPPASLIKKLYKTPFLVTPSLGLQPWLKTILKYRKKNNLPTYTAKTSEKLVKKYSPTGTEEANAHFWLHPAFHCELKDNLVQIFLKWKVTNSIFELICEGDTWSFELSKLNEKIKSSVFILNHDPLMPLLKDAKKVHVLKGSDHHGQVSPSSIKTIIKILKENTSVIWIRESQIHTPASIYKLRRKDDKYIEFDSLGTYPSKSWPLREFIQQLKN